MAPSSNKVADGLLASAHDSAVHDGLRLAVPRFLEAVDALVEENRKVDAASVLAELLAAKEKKRGFLFAKREESALGDERHSVGQRYAQVMRDAAPTEESLDLLNQLAIEFPDDPDIRLSNADALRQAGYLLDALDEFKYCKQLHPDDLALDVRLAEMYAQLGRADEASAQARRAIAAYRSAGDEAGVAALALRLLDYTPGAFEDSLDAFAAMDAAALTANRGPFDAVLAAFVRSEITDPERKADLARRVADCFEKLLAGDRSNQGLWQSLAAVDPGAAEEVRRRLDGVAAAAPGTSAPPSAVPAQPITESAVPAQNGEPVAPSISAAASSAVESISPSPAAAEAAPAASTPAPEFTAAAPGSSAPSAEPAVAAPKRPAATGGLSAFAKRKALELFANSEYEAASVQLERVVKIAPDVEALEMLLECYLVLDRHDEAARVGVTLADAELAAGNRPGAIATLTTLSKKIVNPALEQRRVELMQKP